MTNDSSGNLYLAGDYVGPATLGGLPAAAASAEEDVIVVSLSPKGAVRWIQTFGGPGRDTAHGIAYWGGRVFVTGSHESVFTVGSTALPHRGKSDAFVLGLDGATGSPIWARSLGSTSDDSGADVAADALRVCAVGHGGAALRDTGGKTHAGSGTDGFVAYYYTTGQLQRVRRIGGSTGSDRTLGAAINSMGDCYAAGAFAGTMSAGTTSHTAPTYATNAYVLRVSASNKVTASLVLGAKKNDIRPLVGRRPRRLLAAPAAALSPARRAAQRSRLARTILSISPWSNQISAHWPQLSITRCPGP